jgi:hypothetical protein
MNRQILQDQPVTYSEEVFVNVMIQHLHAVYQATKNGLFIRTEGVKRDVRSFFSLPIPKAVWTKAKPLQNRDFAKFIDTALK